MIQRYRKFLKLPEDDTKVSKAFETPWRWHKGVEKCRNEHYTIVYSLTTWNEFVVDYTLPIKENHQHLHVWLTHSSFLRSGRSLPHPLWRLSLGFDVIAINPRFRRLLRRFPTSFISWLMLTRLALWSSVNTRGTNSGATRSMLRVSLSKLLGMIQSWCLRLQQSLW